MFLIPRNRAPSARSPRPAVGSPPRAHLISGEGVSLHELVSAPLSSRGAQPATLMAAAPVRQRSGPGGPRAQLPPCYYEGYLEKRGPKEKVSAPPVHCHVVVLRCTLCGQCVGVTAHRFMTPPPPPPPVHSQRAVNFLTPVRWARRDCC